MNRLATAMAALRGAESAIQVLLVEAAKAGDYEDAAGLTALLKPLGELIPSDEAEGPRFTTVQEPSAPARRASKKYPYFVRRNDDLIKVGWSKKAKKEYRQATPISSVKAVLLRLSKVGTGRKPTTVDMLQPVVDGDERAVPVYEIYNAIAWLRMIGVLRKRGRDGYILQSQSAAANSVADAWTSMA